MYGHKPNWCFSTPPTCLESQLHNPYLQVHVASTASCCQVITLHSNWRFTCIGRLARAAAALSSFLSSFASSHRVGWMPKLRSVWVTNTVLCVPEPTGCLLLMLRVLYMEPAVHLMDHSMMVVYRGPGLHNSVSPWQQHSGSSRQPGVIKPQCHNLHVNSSQAARPAGWQMCY